MQSDLRSQSKRRSQSRRKKKEAINDPSIKREYEDIEAYLSQILSETHMPEGLLNPKASTATFQQFPSQNPGLKINPNDQSMASLAPNAVGQSA